jgi:hypothetical protein
MTGSPAAIRVLNRVLVPFGELCCDILFELSLAEPLADVRPRVDVEIRLATVADLDLICATYAPHPFLFLGELAPDGSVPEHVRALYADRLNRGELCFIATVDGEVAHLNWTCLTWGDALPGRPIRLERNEVYTTDAVTPAAFRGRNIHAFVLRTMLMHARSLGRDTAYTLAGAARPEGHKGLRRVGWREIGRVWYWLYGNGYKTFILARRGRLDPLSRPAR